MGDESQAECPACHKMLCVHCGVVWHSGELPSHFPIRFEAELAVFRLYL